MNIEFLRNPWLLVAVVLLAGGAFLLVVLALDAAGWACLAAGLAALAFARYRQGV